MKRILLFVLTNLAVVLVLGVVASLLGVNRYLTANGLNLGACWASPSSWALAARSFAADQQALAKWSSGVRVIDGSGSPDERWIVTPCASLPTRPASACPKSVSLKATPTRLPQGLQEQRPGGRVHRPAAKA